MGEKQSDRKWLDILLLLSEKKNDFIVVGGGALALHGIPRSTLDIDIYVRAEQETIASMCELLIDREGLVCEQRSMMLMAANAHLLAGQWMTFSIPGGPDIIDVYLEEVGNYNTLKKETDTIKIHGFSVCVASISQLRQMKAACDRPIDRADIVLIDEYLRLQ